MITWRDYNAPPDATTTTTTTSSTSSSTATPATSADSTSISFHFICFFYIFLYIYYKFILTFATDDQENSANTKGSLRALLVILVFISVLFL